jgi:tripartite-type tricarboxylate transporter receptor subunit TctC
MKQALMQGVFMLVAMGVSIQVEAQTIAREPAYPVKPIRLVVPFPPGGTADIHGRMLGEKLAQRLHQQIVVDNRSGASGNVGLEFVARSPADGYTIVISTVGSWAVNPHLYKLPYDVLNDFAPIIHVANTPGVLAVHPSLPVKTVKELIALARQRPGELTYGSSGVGGFEHMSAELFDSMAKTKMVHVPYKGSAPAILDLIGGHIHLVFGPATPTLPHIQSGRLRAIATTGATRADALAALPTIAEAGVAGYENLTWSAVGAPARTPRSIIDLLNKEFNAVLQMPDIRDALRMSGSTVTGGTPEQFQDYLRSELAKYGKLIKAAGIKPSAGG